VAALPESSGAASTIDAAPQVKSIAIKSCDMTRDKRNILSAIITSSSE
jgi:hypothetical protein